jgi:AraC-like DNA-binding protein
MKTMLSSTGHPLFRLHTAAAGELDTPAQFAEYTILFIPGGKGIYHVDFADFSFAGPVLLFATPIQLLHLEWHEKGACSVLQFHGDFYCIEYHHAEVGCNGLLFNNIYLQPCITLSAAEAGDFQRLLEQMANELHNGTTADIVLKAYLQLFLAKSSSIKTRQLAQEARQQQDELKEQFRQLLDKHYLTLRKPNDYAQLLAMSPGNFTKRCKRYFKKAPSGLIQERLILEAKKQLHLTRKSIKEIAHALHFEDEFYFSRVFKNATRVSPQTFRNQTGISIVADSSMQ